jgi:pSer/pThr/pTyr-binding forkhead associated (FHA) protein
VSRHHAVVVETEEGIAIEDLNSTNGVFVNGERVKRQLLKDGDAIGIGEASLRFVMGSPSVSGAPPHASA